MRKLTTFLIRMKFFQRTIVASNEKIFHLRHAKFFSSLNNLAQMNIIKEGGEKK